VSIEATKYPTPPGNTSIAFCHPKSWVSSSCSYYSIRLAIRAKQLLAITTSQLVVVQLDTNEPASYSSSSWQQRTLN
jgi:hypothetical protein